MIRTLAAALVFACASGAALAQASLSEWTEPGGRFSVSRPAAWQVEDMSRPNLNYKSYVAGTADEECWITDLPSANTAGASPNQILSGYRTAVSEENWRKLAASSRLFYQTQPVAVTSTVETVEGVPVQIARITHPENGEVIAAIHGRAGLEVHVMCVSYDGRDRAAKFLEIAKSVKTPGDAALREAAAAIAAAAQPAPAPAPAAQ